MAANEFVNPVDPGWIGGAQMPGSPDLMKSFDNAFAVHAAVNAKQKQAENQAAMYALRIQQMQSEETKREMMFKMAQDKQTWDMEKFKQNMDWQRYKEQEDTRDKDRMAEYRDWQGQIRENKANEFIGRKQDEAEAAQGFWSALSSLDSKRGSDQYNRDVAKIGAQYGHLAPAVIDNLVSNELNKSGAARDTQQRGYEAEVRDWNTRVGQTLGFGGNTTEQNVPVIMHPENFLKDQTAGGYFGTNFGAQPTGKKIYTTSTGQEKVVEPNDITKLQKDWNDIQTRKPGAPPVYPDLGVNNIEPAPPDKTQMQANHTYRFPTGVFRFDGSDLIPVQVDNTSYPTYRPGAQ